MNTFSNFKDFFLFFFLFRESRSSHSHSNKSKTMAMTRFVAEVNKIIYSFILSRKFDSLSPNIAFVP